MYISVSVLLMKHLLRIPLILHPSSWGGWCRGCWEGGRQRAQVRRGLWWRPAGTAAASSCSSSSLWLVGSETRSSPVTHKHETWAAGISFFGSNGINLGCFLSPLRQLLLQIRNVTFPEKYFGCFRCCTQLWLNGWLSEVALTTIRTRWAERTFFH